MNIVFDEGVKLDTAYRKGLIPILPEGKAALKLDSMTYKTDGTPNIEEGFVFITDLPVDIMKYHSEFFKEHRDAPQWFFVVVSKRENTMTELKKAARKYNLKNCKFFGAKDPDSFAMSIKEIVTTKTITKGKALLFSKHKCAWVTDFANVLFGKNENKYDIMDSVNMNDSDADVLLLCGEKVTDFKNINLPADMEPYFVCNFSKEPQCFINLDSFIVELAEHYHMTAERLKSRFYYVNIESEKWLLRIDESSGRDAISAGILLYDQFGLPVSRKEYSVEAVHRFALENHKSIEKIKEILL